MKGTMKAVQPSYLHLSNILSGRVGFSGRVIESSFSTRPECSNYRVKLLNPTRVLGFNFSTRLNTFPKKFQLDPTLFESSTRLELEYST